MLRPCTDYMAHKQYNSVKAIVPFLCTLLEPLLQMFAKISDALVQNPFINVKTRLRTFKALSEVHAEYLVHGHVWTV